MGPLETNFLPSQGCRGCRGLPRTGRAWPRLGGAARGLDGSPRTTIVGTPGLSLPRDETKERSPAQHALLRPARDVAHYRARHVSQAESGHDLQSPNAAAVHREGPGSGQVRDAFTRIQLLLSRFPPTPKSECPQDLSELTPPFLQGLRRRRPHVRSVRRDLRVQERGLFSCWCDAGH